MRSRASEGLALRSYSRRVVVSVDAMAGGHDGILYDLVSLTRPAWHARAACRGRGVGAFFDERSLPTVSEARALCGSCPVRVECLAAALADAATAGVRAGTTRLQRAAMGAERLRDAKRGRDDA